MNAKTEHYRRQPDKQPKSRPEALPSHRGRRQILWVINMDRQGSGHLSDDRQACQ